MEIPFHCLCFIENYQQTHLQVKWNQTRTNLINQLRNSTTKRKEKKRFHVRSSSMFFNERSGRSDRRNCENTSRIRTRSVVEGIPRSDRRSVVGVARTWMLPEVWRCSFSSERQESTRSISRCQDCNGPWYDCWDSAEPIPWSESFHRIDLWGEHLLYLPIANVDIWSFPRRHTDVQRRYWWCVSISNHEPLSNWSPGVPYLKKSSPMSQSTSATRTRLGHDDLPK